MPFSLDSALTRPKPRPWIKRHPVLFPLILFVLLSLGYFSIQTSTQDPAFGIIPVKGVILESEPVVRKLRSLEDDPQIKGIIVHINSPGGAVAASQEIFTELLRIRKKIPVYSSIASVAASGGYYVAIGTQKIYANPGSLTGSIGVIMQTYNVKQLLDKVGVYTETIKSGKNKDVGSVFREMRPEERLLLEGVINDTHKQFVQATADNRPLDVSEVKSLADGSVFTGQQAHKNGLVDGLLSFRETINQLKNDIGLKGEVQLIYPEDEKTLLTEILDSVKSLLTIKKEATLSGLLYLNRFL